MGGYEERERERSPRGERGTEEEEEIDQNLGDRTLIGVGPGKSPGRTLSLQLAKTLTSF